MRCHKCNQDSIDIQNGHILCDICGLDIDVSLNLEEDNFFDLFFYNKNLEEAEKLGEEALTEGLELSDNPYSIGPVQIILNKRWELGYKREKESYEFSALSLSAKKIEDQLKTDIKVITEEKEHLDSKIDSFLSENYKLITDHCSKLLSRKILGPLLNKVISSFQQDIKILYRTWNLSK